MGYLDTPARWRSSSSRKASSSSNTTFLSVAAATGDTLLPSTFVCDGSTTNNNTDSHHHHHHHHPYQQQQQELLKRNHNSSRSKKSKQPQNINSQKYPQLLLQRNGVWTLHSNAILILSIIGACLLLGVHVYLFRQLTWGSSSSNHQEEDRILSRGGSFGLQQNASSSFITTNHQHQQQQKSSLRLTPLKAIDREQYTIRINTWQRLDQLLVSIDHHASCPGVAQIQVVWCEPIDPPSSLTTLHPDKVVVERHAVNSLNERFHILSASSSPTLGILSMDDDVLRSCDAIDAGFFQWTQSPHRMVGFDYRTHVENNDGSWKYGYLSTTQKANRYSLSLPRYAFLHRDYLDWYMTELPRPIFDHVAESFNCEDIAMSFFISSLTNGRPPLLAPLWSIESMVKLYSAKRISGTKDHKSLRDACVESFAQQLQLKGQLYRAPVLYRNDTMFYSGDMHYDEDVQKYLDPSLLVVEPTAGVTKKPSRQVAFENTMDEWKRKQGKHPISKRITEMKEQASSKAKIAGLIEHTEAWKKKYGHES